MYIKDIYISVKIRRDVTMKNQQDAKIILINYEDPQRLEVKQLGISFLGSTYYTQVPVEDVVQLSMKILMFYRHVYYFRRDEVYSL